MALESISCVYWKVRLWQPSGVSSSFLDGGGLLILGREQPTRTGDIKIESKRAAAVLSMERSRDSSPPPPPPQVSETLHTPDGEESIESENSR